MNKDITGHTCSKCGRSHPEVDFGLRCNTHGVAYPHNKCKGCYAATRRGSNEALRKHFGIGVKLKDVKPPVGTPCQICETPMTHGKGPKSVNMDHCHQTNTFRGWLCRECNTGLGKLGDNIHGLEKAVLYLSTCV